MDRKLHLQLTEEVTNLFETLGEDRKTIVANYYATCVRVGFDVDKNAKHTEITSASNRSPIGNVVSRLTHYKSIEEIRSEILKTKTAEEIVSEILEAITDSEYLNLNDICVKLTTLAIVHEPQKVSRILDTLVENNKAVKGTFAGVMYYGKIR